MGSQNSTLSESNQSHYTLHEMKGTEKNEKEEKIVRRVVSKQKVQAREKLNEGFELILFENASAAAKASLLVGVGDIGITPIVTSNSLIEQLDLPYIGALRDLSASPACVISGGRAMHSIRIFGDQRLIVVVADSKVKEAKHAQQLVDALVKCLPHFQSTMIFCAEGSPTETTERMERKELQFVCTNESHVDKLMELNHKPLQEAVIAGISGGILAECTTAFSQDFDVCILLAPTCSFYPDIWASVLIIQTLSELLAFETNTDTLERNAKKLEDKAKELMGIHEAGITSSSSLYM